MKKKIIAMILAAAISCQPVMIYAADAEVEFSDGESDFIDDIEVDGTDTDISEISVSEDIADEEVVDVDMDDSTEEIYDNENNVEIISDGEFTTDDKELWDVETELASDLVFDNFKYTLSNGNVKITGYVGSESMVVIPEEIDTYKVSGLGAGTFQKCENLKEVDIPSSVQEIGESAFKGCKNLSTVKFHNNTEIELNIGAEAFSGCSVLENIEFPEQTVSLGYEVIAGTGIEKLIIPSKVKSSGYYNSGHYGAVYGATKLKEVIFEEGIESIPRSICAGGESIEKVSLPSSIKTIGMDAFKGCKNLKEIFFSGSEEEWKKITIADGNEELKSATIYYNKNWEAIISDYNYSLDLKRWMNDEGTYYSMQYLSTDSNFVNSLMVANYDSSFLDEFIENTSNLVFGGVKGWENYWSEATKQEQARKILVSLLTSYEDDVEALSIVETAKKFADTYVATLKSGNWAYAVEYGLNSDEITRLSELCKNDNVYEFFVNGEYGKLSHYLQKVGGYASDSKIIQCVKSFSESKELAKALTDNLETFGKALTVVKVTDATVTRYFDIMRLCKADELYCDMLLYLANNSSYAPIQKAAADVYQVIQGDCLKQLEYLTKDITDTLKEKALDEALEAVTQNVSLKTIAIKSYKYSVNLANLIFNTADAQEQKDNMRCAAYIGAYLGRWMQSNKESYLNSSGDEKNQFARKTVYAYYMLLKTRLIGEQSGRKFMELLVFKKGSRQYKLSLEITSTLESIEKALKCSGVLGNCYSSSVVACPVDVEVCDKAGKTVLTVYDGKESSGNVNGIYYNVYYHPLDEDYVKVINLPVDGGYTLKCKANDLGKVEYYVSTISKDGGVTRKEAVEIPVQKGNQIQITNISDKQPTCKLIDNNGSVKKEYIAEEKDTKQVAVTSVKATSSTLEMKKGEKKIVNVNIVPENATNRELLWTSTNNAIAKVNSDGVVQGISAGSADIKAVSAENEKIYAKIRVTVKNVETAVKRPSTPKLTKITPAYDSITIRWNKVAGAKGYLIYRKTNTGGWKALKYTSGTSYKDKSVRVENKYTYTVKAYKVANGKKIFGGYDKKGLASRLTTTISLSKTKTKKVIVSWKATSGASGYEVYRASSPKGKYTKIKTINGRKTVKYTDSKAKKGKTYYYKVTPFIKKGKKIIRGTSSTTKKITVK